MIRSSVSSHCGLLWAVLLCFSLYYRLRYQRAGVQLRLWDYRWSGVMKACPLGLKSLQEHAGIQTPDAWSKVCFLSFVHHSTTHSQCSRACGKRKLCSSEMLLSALLCTGLIIYYSSIVVYYTIVLQSGHHQTTIMLLCFALVNKFCQIHKMYMDGVNFVWLIFSIIL